MNGMMDLAGRTAFVTGAGSGIGLAIARSLLAAGAQVMLADRDAERLTEARAELGADERIATVVCDVADPLSVAQAAETTRQRFAKIHILINNAGVSLTGRAGDTRLEDWRWIIDINLMGVVHGLETFVPLIRAHGEGGYVVNTASMAGHLAAPGLGPYTATKFAVVGLSETLRQDLAQDGIGVSVLCPGWVRTDIHNTARGRPSACLGGADSAPFVAEVESGIDPDLVGDWTVEGIRAGRFYIFTHPQMASFVEARYNALMRDYAACIADPRLAPRSGR